MTAPERSYPRQLAQRVRDGWPAGARPLPAGLEAILDAAYHASFLHDEARPVACRILVISPDELAADGGPPGALLPLVFAAPRGFDEHELRRLSPAADAPRALIGVDEVAGKLVTWGIVQSGPRWLAAAQGGRAVEPPVPACLVVRIVRPGNLVVACGSRLVGELRGGRLSDFAIDVFQSQWLPAVFADARHAATAEHGAMAGPRLDADAAGGLSRYVTQQMLKRVVSTIRGAHHGGLLVVGPPDCAAERILAVKYALHDAPARRRFQLLVQTILKAVADRAAAAGQPAGLEFYRSDADPRIAELDESLFEMSHLIASLASVDGAVVLTKRFEILGFGAEIAGALPQVSDVRRGLDLEADRYACELVDVVGTRHRSAYRFAAAVPRSVAVVISQDGGVRFVTHHRGAVTYWDHGAGDT
ncbi:MAG TPA: hypothetical protein VHW23_25580 [Kofleriaceae bacterium]|jgi:hypothetical protein|nr:hypothetical protein [Kofleriaceae bacterium]